MYIPDELKQGRWVNWQFSKTTSAKPTKVPCDPSGIATSVTGNCFSFDEVYAAYLSKQSFGVGYVFKGDGIIGIDIDKAEPDEIQQWSALDTYVELSPSGKGVHIFTKGVIPGERRRRGRYEIYCDKRFFTFTGRQISSTEIIKEIDLSKFYDRYLGQVPTNHQKTCLDQSTQYGTGGRPQCQIKTNNNPTAITNMTDLMSTLLLNDKFYALYNGHVHSYSSASEAELAMCSIIGKYTQDMHTIDSIVKSSKLLRSKWTSKRGNQTYGYLTILKALK